MATIRLSVSAIVGTNKKGIIKPDADGYRDMTVGGLGIRNNGGHLYVEKEASDVFTKASSFMRRVRSGKLYGEYGHPKKHPNERMDEFVRRSMYINEEMKAVHHRDVWLLTGKDIPGAPAGAVGIMSSLKPSGPYAAALEGDLSNGYENTAFSIRALSKDVNIGGEIARCITVPITFDAVTEQGVGIAEKWKSPNMESYEITDQIIPMGTLVKISDEIIRSPLVSEANKELADELLSLLTPRTTRSTAIYSSWK